MDLRLQYYSLLLIDKPKTVLNICCPQLQSITAYEISCKLMNSPRMGKKAHLTSQQSGQGHVRESSKNDLILNVLLSLKP